MAINDNATLVIGSGNYFLAPVGTAIPANLDAISTPWTNIGHTSIEDIMSWESDGGEATVLGTLQNAALRTSYSKRTEKFTIQLQQFDESSLKLYFGSNATADLEGWVAVPGSPAPTVQAFLAVYVDGENIFAVYAPKAEILRGDDIDLSDTESLASLPISVTPVQYGSNTYPYKVKALDAV